MKISMRMLVLLCLDDFLVKMHNKCTSKVKKEATTFKGKAVKFVNKNVGLIKSINHELKIQISSRVVVNVPLCSNAENVKKLSVEKHSNVNLGRLRSVIP